MTISSCWRASIVDAEIEHVVDVLSVLAETRGSCVGAGVGAVGGIGFDFSRCFVALLGGAGQPIPTRVLHLDLLQRAI